jgi:hypothetical protein
MFVAPLATVAEAVAEDHQRRLQLLVVVQEAWRRLEDQLLVPLPPQLSLRRRVRLQQTWDS